MKSERRVQKVKNTEKQSSCSWCACTLAIRTSVRVTEHWSNRVIIEGIRKRHHFVHGCCYHLVLHIAIANPFASLKF